MKISINWLREFINLTASPQELADKLTLSGLEVEGQEKFDQIPGGLEGLVVGEVLSVQKHPNADRLSLTQVDVGEAEPLPIVCGAPNVAEKQKVIVAKVGATLYPTKGDSFAIKKSKIRGEVSRGMICAEDEIGLGTQHDGIMVLDTQLPNGTPAADYFGLVSDQVLEIGLTPNRADAASHFGVARDLKALYHQPLTLPNTENFSVDNQNLPIEVVVENTEACPRYSGLTISGVAVQDSPDWLQARLRAIGLSPINNIVDATNYVLHGLGQPMHAFDADAITGGKVIVKTLPEGSTFTTLDEKERKLLAQDLMICNAEEGMCIAGVFGGIKSGVKASTQNIFLESAYFSPEYIRRTAQHHSLKTDASFRYERGTDPNITVYALKVAALLIKEIAGGQISSSIVDVYPNAIESFRVAVKYKNVDRLIGKQIDRGEITEILQQLEIEVVEENETSITVLVPPYRVDVQREADIIEEILRIHGYDQVVTADYLSADYIARFPEIDDRKLQLRLSEMLVGNGFYEMVTNSLTKPAYVQEPTAVSLYNPLSEDLNVMRQHLLFSGLEVIAHNINRQQKNLKFFEFGTTYRHQEDKYLEAKELVIFMTGLVQAESWMASAEPVSFHHLSSHIQIIFNRFGITGIVQEPLNDPFFSYGLQLTHQEKIVAKLGKIDTKTANLAEVKQPVFCAVVQWLVLLEKLRGTSTKERTVFQEISKFPEVRRDLSLVLDQEVTFREVEQVAKANGNNLVKRINVFDVYEGEQLVKGRKAYALSFILQDQHRTLTDKIIDKTMNRLMKQFEQELHAEIRQ
ncbi:phenylalanine--tRNA ligase subunit beta [Tunicatimonas pelagia]|uniref:phenylalanine--tRNA ligase subunit beta n=1 Tax=Tunicatimonas pelagia TaxID=931531 RepID=UPI0026663F77|nr:phenylalanine--tRNA ligase subunit beta [Tunicatimonas pelagia]WKN45724.1 phenylalanine--tRNA ligase subunit beta [Tunicatimonas pelagia]